MRFQPSCMLFSILVSDVYSMSKASEKLDAEELDPFRETVAKNFDQSHAGNDMSPEVNPKFFPDLQNINSEAQPSTKTLIRLVRSDRNHSRQDNEGLYNMDDDLTKTTGFGSKVDRGEDTDERDDGLLGSTSDYVLIAMIVAMMFCMTLCCLCLFCRSSSRLSICGINFELNERRNSLDDPENQSEIHEVVPLTPTTAGDYQNRLPDIENMLRSDAPPPMYNEIVKKAEAASGQQAKSVQAKGQTGKSLKKKSQNDRPSESSSVRSNGIRSSWRFSGRGILASFRAKSSMLRSRRSDSAIQCPTVQEGAVSQSRHSDHALPPTIEEVDSARLRTENSKEVTIETVDEVTKENNAPAAKKVFVYDVNELPPDEDDDVFL